jgi:hypothetical protein
MARSPKLHSAGSLIDQTRVSDPNKPVSIYFDECAMIAKNIAIWGYGGGFAWERAYMLKGKYMCPKNNPHVRYCESCEGL